MPDESHSEFLAEVEAKLDILRRRAKAYQDFVAPEGQPPLLWQMAMLADAGFTVLPPVRDPDPGKCFPELHVAMEPLEWSDEHYCLVGGEEFLVMRVPSSYNGHLLRPKAPPPPAYFVADLPLTVPTFDVEHYRRKDFAVAVHGRVVWRSRIMVA